MHPNTDMPRPIAIRPAVPTDLHDVLLIRQTQEIADNGTPFTTTDRLSSDWDALGARLAQRVWVAAAAGDGSLVACAELACTDQVFVPRLWVLPDHRDRGLETALLREAEQRARVVSGQEHAQSITFFAQATSAHPAAREALARAGYAITSTYEKMELVLHSPPANPEVVSGIEIRPFATGQDAEAVYRADEDAFQDQRGYTPRTFERWCQRLNVTAETFDPELWRIAWDGNQIAGVALSEIVERVGWIHHLSVRRPWRRRGLGAALMRSAFGALHQRGIHTLRLNVDAQSLTNAHQLYRRLGFRVTGTYANCEKTVPLQ